METYTVPYTESVIKYKTVTRKLVYIQRRRKVKRTLNKPVLVIKRKVVKDRQFFERIVPKVIETREIINKPKIQYKVIEGPMEEASGNKPVEQDEDCDDDNTVPPPPEAAIQGSFGASLGGNAVYESGSYDQRYSVGNAENNDIKVGFDFASALNHGLSAAFSAGAQTGVQPRMRSGDFAATTVRFLF